MPELNLFPFLLALGLPIALTLTGNFIRGLLGVSASNGSDLILTAAGADVTLMILNQSQITIAVTGAAPVEVTLLEPEIRLGLTVALILALVLFTISTQFQSIKDEIAHCSWANENLPHKNTKRFTHSRAYPHVKAFFHWIGLQVFLASHIVIFLLARG